MERYYFFEDDMNDLEKEIGRLHQKLTRVREDAVRILTRRDTGLEPDATCVALSAIYDIYNKQLTELSYVRNHAVDSVLLQKSNGKRVSMGKVVVVHNTTDDKNITLNIKSYWIARNGDNQVAYSAPLPELLMGAKVGEIREGFIGGVKKSYEIKEIKP